MFHMLSSFDLPEGTEVDEFNRAIRALDEYLRQHDLLHATGPISRRVKHEVMDTDEERNQQWAFIMTFRDRNQCDRSVQAVYENSQPLKGIHDAVWTQVRNPMFTCWEDIESN